MRKEVIFLVLASTGVLIVALSIPTFADDNPSAALPQAGYKLYLPWTTKASVLEDPIILASGDSRDGCTSQAYAVSSLLDAYPGAPFLHNGDTVTDGTDAQYADCYDKAFGRQKSRTRPVPGNHEYHSGAVGYFDYFGANAGPRDKGYYSFNVGTWHLVMLNSQIDISDSSAQVQWLKADLAANATACTLAMWHRPRWSSGAHGPQSDMAPAYQALYDAGVELLLSGHDHDYERFAPQNPAGQLDKARGIRQFVIGTGGVALRAFGTIRANSEVRNSATFGAVKFTLHPTSYDWKFIPIAGQTSSDAGTTACH